MDDTSAKPNGMRKTTKAAIAGSFFLLSLRPMRDLKEFVMGDQIVTNERIEKTMAESFARLEHKIEKHVEEDVVVHRRLRDMGREDDLALEARCEKHTDKVEARVDALVEASILLKPKRPTN